MTRIELAHHVEQPEFPTNDTTQKRLASYRQVYGDGSPMPLDGRSSRGPVAGEKPELKLKVSGLHGYWRGLVSENKVIAGIHKESITLPVLAAAMPAHVHSTRLRVEVASPWHHITVLNPPENPDFHSRYSRYVSNRIIHERQLREGSAVPMRV